jgi:hypothetical protein
MSNGEKDQDGRIGMNDSFATGHLKRGLEREPESRSLTTAHLLKAMQNKPPLNPSTAETPASDKEEK